MAKEKYITRAERGLPKVTPRHTRSKRKAVSRNDILDAVFKDQPKHIRRWCEKHSKSLKEGLDHFRSLAKHHKRVKAKANRAKHKANCIENSRDRRNFKRRAEYELKQAEKKALREQRIAFARAASTTSSVVAKTIEKFAKLAVVVDNPVKASRSVLREVSMSGASTLPLAA